MPDADKVMGEFMLNKNKENLGEQVEIDTEKNDNFLTDSEIVKSGFTNESINENDKAAAVIKNIMNMFITIPIIIGSIFLIFYFVMKITPSVLSFTRSLILKLFSV